MFGVFFHERKENDIKPTHHSCLFIASIAPFNHKHKYSIMYKWIFSVVPHPYLLPYMHHIISFIPTFPPPIHPFWLPNHSFST